MRRSTAVVVSVAWGVALGGTFACLLLGSPAASMDAR
jgi:hypothetical protein